MLEIKPKPNSEITTEIKKLRDETLVNLKSSKADNTVRAYKSDFKDFDLFCIKNDFKNTGRGYKVFSREIFAPDFGIPQSRRRIFFIGVSKDFLKRNKIDFNEDDLFPEKEFSDKDTLFDKYLRYPVSKSFFIDLQKILELVSENDFIDISGRKGFWLLNINKYLSKYLVPALQTT